MERVAEVGAVIAGSSALTPAWGREASPPPCSLTLSLNGAFRHLFLFGDFYYDQNQLFYFKMYKPTFHKVLTSLEFIFFE